MKRIPYFLEKVAMLQLNFASDLQKITDHELSKSERTQQDQMMIHAHGYHKIQHVIGYMASQMTQFSNRLLSDVTEPIIAFYKESTKFWNRSSAL